MRAGETYRATIAFGRRSSTSSPASVGFGLRPALTDYNFNSINAVVSQENVLGITAGTFGTLTSTYTATEADAGKSLFVGVTAAKPPEDSLRSFVIDNVVVELAPSM